VFLGLLRRVDDLVVDVGVVAHVTNVEAFVTEVPHDDVERGEGARVADVHEAVDGRPAHVDANLPGRQGFELVFGLGHRVVDLDCGHLPLCGHCGRPPICADTPVSGRV